MSDQLEQNAAPAQDNRLGFDEATRFVIENRAAAFAVTPVFDDDHELAAGARIFLLEHDGASGYRLRFIAGPFFSAAYAANEVYAAADIPERVRELRFIPTRYEEDWLSDQIQLLIQKLMQASGNAPAQMPDYQSAPAQRADAATVFPVAFIGRGDTTRH